jgi:hypothetical protein
MGLFFIWLWNMEVATSQEIIFTTFLLIRAQSGAKFSPLQLYSTPIILKILLLLVMLEFNFFFVLL